jgi:hypothetical protein
MLALRWDRPVTHTLTFPDCFEAMDGLGVPCPQRLQGVEGIARTAGAQVAHSACGAGLLVWMDGLALSPPASLARPAKLDAPQGCH